jgi:hypothetical protein
MRNIYLFVSAGLALAASGATLAQTAAPEPAPGRSALGTLDTDRDGSISRTEATMNPGLSAQFPMLDKNSNGALEPGEFSRFESEAGAGTGRMPTTPPPGNTLRPPTNPGNPPASLQLDTNTPPELNGIPPPSDSTPPPLESTPPPLGASQPPAGATPPANSTTQPKTGKPGTGYQPRSATSAGGPGDDE